MRKRIKFKVGDFVYYNKLKLTSRVTAVRDYGCYVKRDEGTLCCPWQDVEAASKEQIREYLKAESRKKTAKKELTTAFKPFHGGSKKSIHPVKPKAIHIRLLKEVLTFLNLKYEVNEKQPKSTLRYPISAVWHSSGTITQTFIKRRGEGLEEIKTQYGYGWTLVYDWMWLADDVKFQAYVKAMQAKCKPKGLTFDCVFTTHNKVKYSGLLSIKPVLR